MLKFKKKNKINYTKMQYFLITIQNLEIKNFIIKIIKAIIKKDYIFLNDIINKIFLVDFSLC